MGDFLQDRLGASVAEDPVRVDDIVQPVEPTGTALPAQTDEPKLEFLGTALNSSVPFAYGRHLVAGAPIFEHKLATTGQTVLFIALGEGEWDSVEVVWVNGAEINIADTNLFHFHPGFDGETGTETTPATPNQKICNFIPVGFTGMTFSKTAYIALTLPADPTAPGPEFDIRGIYKTRKVRTFDANGNQTGYLFSANPAWQLLDAFLLLHLKPHSLAGEALTQADKDRIDFAAFKSAADFCDVDIGGGVKRFESHVVFLSETNLATIFDTLMALCRGYLLEQYGKLGLYIDQSRSSVYTFTRSNILASSFRAPAKPLRSLANRLVIKTRDIESGGGTVSKDFAPWTKTLDDESHQDRVGRIIKKDFDLGANTRERAERVGRYWMNRSLKLSEQGRMVASPDAGALLPGDRVTGPARTDFSSTRDWEVIEISDNPGGTREVSVQAYDESIFSDTAETQQGVEETTIPTSAQTALSPTGAHFFFNGVFVPDQNNGIPNVGEIDFDPRKTGGDYLIGHPDGTEFIIANANRSLVSQVALDTYTGRVFIVFSKQKVVTERSLTGVQDSHIIVLRLTTSGAWEYDNQTTWVAFTPDPSDILIFEVDRSGTGWAGKPTRYVGQELLSATEAGRLQYASGATVESLEPGEVGANVTEDHTGVSVDVLANFSFEDGQIFWSNPGGQAVVVTDAGKAHEGNKYLEIGSSGPIGNGQVLNDGTTEKTFEVTVGMIVEFGGWAYRETGDGDMRFQLSLLNDNKVATGTVNTPAVTAAVWTNVKAKHTIAAGTKYVGFRCRRDAVTVSGLSRYDDCFLRRNRPADSVEYAGGSTVESLEPGEVGANVTEDHTGVSVDVLANFSFEDGQIFWGTSGGQAIVTTNATKAHEGNKYLQIGSSGAIGSTQVLNDGTTEKAFEVTVGMIVEFGGWAYRETGNGDMRFQLSLLNENKVVISTVDTPAVTAAVWTKVTAKHTVVAGTKYVGFRCRRDAVTVSGLSRYDDCFLRRNRPADSVEYAGGSTVESLEPAEVGATLGADWPTDLTGRPTELTDGRVSAGLDSAGDVARDVKTDKVVTGSIKDLNLTTSKVAASAINEVGSFANAGNVTTTDSNEVEIGCVTVSSDTDDVEITAKCSHTTSGVEGSYRLRKGTITGTQIDFVLNGTRASVSLHAVDTTPASSQEYTFTFQRTITTNISCSWRTMTAGNRKK